MTEQTVLDEWRERRDLTLAVKERVEHQLQVLNLEILPGTDPNADQQRRLDDLRFELSQLEEAFNDAEQRLAAGDLATGEQPAKGEENDG